MNKSELIDLHQRPGATKYTAMSSSMVGINAGPGWELRVHPKCPIRNLLYLLGFSTDAGWMDEAATGDVADLVATIAHAFLFHAERATARGFLHGYVWVDADLPAPRGRIDFARQIRSRSGLPIPTAVRYEEYSPDIPENRLIKAACARLEYLESLSRTNRAGIRHLSDRLSNVTTLPARSQVLPPRTKLNQHYASALELAWLIVRATSPSHDAGSALMTTFVFDMNRVFEEFIGANLARRLQKRGGNIRFRSAYNSVRTVPLDDDGVVIMEPDITWLKSGVPQAVVDVKYKRSPSSGDYYQALAYATALNLADSHLILPTTSESTQRSSVLRVQGRRLHLHYVGLNQDPSGIDAHLDEIANGMVPPT